MPPPAGLRWWCPPFVQLQAAFRVDPEGVPIKEVFQGIRPSCAAGVLGGAVLAQAVCQVLRHIKDARVPNISKA